MSQENAAEVPVIKARVFKSYMPYVRIQFGIELEAVFKKGRLVTIDEKLIAKLDDIVKNDKNLGVYIDPEERETDYRASLTSYQLKQQEVQEYLAKQSATLDAGTTEQSTLKVVSTADSVTTGGRGVATQHFSREDIAAALKAKLAK